MSKSDDMGNPFNQYQFLRYYLPGFLFFLYVAIILLPQVNPSFIIGLDLNAVIAIFGLIGVASPVIGYLIYASFNYFYENYWAEKYDEKRKALKFIKETMEKNKDERYFYRNACDEKKKFRFGSATKPDKMSQFREKKALLDFLYLAEVEKSEDKITLVKTSGDSAIPALLKNHLSNYASRRVCSMASFFATAVAFVFLLFGCSNNSIFIFDPVFLGIAITAIFILSIILVKDSSRILKEAYEIENYFIRSKVGVLLELLPLFFGDDIKK